MYFSNTNVSMRRYVLGMAVASLIPSALIAIALATAGIIDEESRPVFAGSALFLLISTLMVAPAIETLLMSAVLWPLSFFTDRILPLAVVSAVIWAGLHSLAAPVWGLTVVWPFFVFSYAYLTWRKKGWWRAVWVTFWIHVFQNLLPGVLVAVTDGMSASC